MIIDTDDYISLVIVDGKIVSYVKIVRAGDDLKEDEGEK